MQKKTLLLILTICFLVEGLVNISLAATLHAVVVADTNDRTIGESAETDLSRMKSVIESISDNTRLVLKGYDIAATGFTHDNVIGIVNELPVERNDVVIFYYAGHGIRAGNKRSRWPFLSFNNKLLDFDQVISIIEAKRPRFFIAIADACNTFDDSFSILQSRSSPNRNMSKVENYQELFLNYSGYIIASGAKPGQNSWGNKQEGGFFTHRFVDELYKGLAAPNPDWRTIMERATTLIPFADKVQIPQFTGNIKRLYN